MVNRNNFQLAKQFLAYMRDVMQLNPESTDRYWSYLKHLLLWADEAPLSKVTDKRPPFAVYLTTSRQEGKVTPFAPMTLKKIFQISKRFLVWAKITYPRDFRSIPPSWIEAIRLPRTIQETKDHQFVTVEEVRKLARLEISDNDWALQRDQAAAVMLFLSGMRAGALGSLTIECVNIQNRTVKQWTSLGVKTKNSKSATTYLLDIPELIAVVEKWDAFIRARLPSTAPWYTPTISRWGEQILSADHPGANRNIALAKRLRKLFKTAGLPYRSPHRFRHGHAVYALQHATTMADYKAVSMNLMHSDIRTTDSIYAPLARDEVKERIAGLTESMVVQETTVGDNPFPTGRLSNDELIATIAQRLGSPSHR